MIPSHNDYSVIAVTVGREREVCRGGALECLRAAQERNRPPYQTLYIVARPDGRRLSIRQQERILRRLEAQVNPGAGAARDMRAQADDYRIRRGLVEAGGLIVFWEGEVCGWMQNRQHAEKWCPGCLAVDEYGRWWIAIGSSGDGAERWESA